MLEISKKKKIHIRKFFWCENKGDEVKMMEIEKDRGDGKVENAGCRK